MKDELRQCDECGCFLERLEAEYGSEVWEELEENQVPGPWSRDVCNNDSCQNLQDFDRSRWKA